jgi:secondary thiamine-phosphate synthase enzyme
MQEIQVSTGKREELVNITDKVQSLIRENGWQDGAVLVYCTHTTAGVTINEAADPSVVRDILVTMGRMVPEKGDYKHMEGNSDAHIKSSLVGCSEMVIVEQGRLVLGTWQGLFFADFDGPRSRKVRVKWLAGG